MKINQKKRANHKGVVLFTAVMVMALLFILMTAILSFVYKNTQTTNNSYKQKQAYMTASSTLESFIAQIQTDTAPTSDATAKAAQKKAIENLRKLAEANGGKGTTTEVSYNGKTDNTDNMGTCKITVAKEGTSTANIVITCEATYLGETEQAAAHISTESAAKSTDYTNAIELTGSDNVTYDNLYVVGDMAGINNTTGKVYSFTNNSSIYGSYFMYGSLANTTQLSLILKPSLTDGSMGTNVTVSENLIAQSNDLRITSTMTRADGYNFVNIGQSLNVVSNAKLYVGTSGFDIDIYCANVSATGNDFEQYGNLYVYDSGDGTNKGDAAFNINGSGATIHGNLYVEGNLNLTQKLKVQGDVYVCGTISNSSKLNCTGTVHQGSSVVLSKVGRDAKPVIPAKSDEYVYYPEDFLMSNDTNLTNLSSIYKGFYDGSNTKTFNTFGSKYGSDGYVITDPTTGTKSAYTFMVNESCTWANDLDAGKYGNGLKVLINVTDDSGDIVIRLANGLTFGSNFSPTVIVKNDSSIDTKTGDRKYSCYFVSDAGPSISVSSTLGADGKSVHSGATPCTYNFEHLVVLDYQCYIRMYSGTTLTKPKVNHGAVDSSFILNPTSVDDATIGVGSYQPESNSIIFLFTKDTTFNATNDSLIQACVYAPEAKYNIQTNGLNVNVTDAAGSIMKAGTCNIGVIIASNFNSANKAHYVFNEPSANSILSKTKGTDDDSAYGYTLDRYDHY